MGDRINVRVDGNTVQKIARYSVDSVYQTQSGEAVTTKELRPGVRNCWAPFRWDSLTSAVRW